MIRAYLGRQRMGKTYCMVQDLYFQVKWMGDKRPIYTNFDLNIPGAEIIRLKDPIEIVNLENGILVIDEIGKWFPADKWKDFPGDIGSKFSQASKVGLDFYFTSQYLGQSYTKIRNVIDEIRRFSRLGRFILVTYYSVDDKHFGSTVKYKKDAVWVRYRNNKIGSMYNTHEKIESPWGNKPPRPAGRFV